MLHGNSVAGINNQLLKKLDLQRELFSDQYQSFEINQQPFIYLLHENTTAITRGVAVLLADSGVSVAGKKGFVPLAKELNKLGWVTIILPAPEIAFTPVADESASTETTEGTVAENANDNAATATTSTNTDTNNPNPDINGSITPVAPDSVDPDINKASVSGIDNLAFLQHEEQLIALLQAAKVRSEDYPGFFLVISQGTSAAWLSKIYAEEKIETPDALVTISPYWPDRKFNQLLAQWLANTPMPVLDLYNQWDNEWARKTVNAREIAAIRSLKLQYRQRQLLGVDLHQQDSTYLSKEIYGWLSHMGW